VAVKWHVSLPEVRDFKGKLVLRRTVGGGPAVRRAHDLEDILLDLRVKLRGYKRLYGVYVLR
jgi:hypothetical protein